MKLQTQIPFSKAIRSIDYSSRLLLLGSCFVENIGKKLSYYKFQAVQNPLGILFHPKAIESLVLRSIKNTVYTEEDLFCQDGCWHCFDAHSDLSDTVKGEVLQKLNNGLEQTKKELQSATHIMITLGTAWIYRHLQSNSIVANCHKVPQREFSKELLSTEAVVTTLGSIVKAIQSVNNAASVIFTVSPVRHLKDGFVENQRSKAHLISAVHGLLHRSHPVDGPVYFESYELMMDELRDYRFYEADMVHPNSLAIEYIWEKFKLVWLSETTYPVMEEVASIRKGLNHRPFNENSEQHKKFIKSLQGKIAYLQKTYPFMKFNG
jgi:hypothetical protein